jgi:RimK family alpha-L-glutamate ligase
VEREASGTVSPRARTPARRSMLLVGYPLHAMTSRLHQLLLERGHACQLIHPDRLVTETSAAQVVVHPIGHTRPDVVVLTTSTDHIAAVHGAAHLETLGIPVLNRPAAILLAADKAQTAITLARAAVPVPRTTCVSSVDAALEYAEHLGYPLVLKAADGAEGNQVRRVHDAGGLSQTFRALRASMGHPDGSRVPLVLQELLSRAIGHDRRLFVVGGFVLAAMDRAARSGEWRSNLSQGAEPLPATATPAEIDIAQRASRTLGLDLTTIDLMAGPTGPVVIEANAYGDVLDVGMTSGLDLIAAIADLVEMRAGVRPLERVAPRSLSAPDHRALTDFCLRRLRQKREELGPPEAAVAASTAPCRRLDSIL